MKCKCKCFLLYHNTSDNVSSYKSVTEHNDYQKLTDHGISTQFREYIDSVYDNLKKMKPLNLFLTQLKNRFMRSTRLIINQQFWLPMLPMQSLMELKRFRKVITTSYVLVTFKFINELSIKEIPFSSNIFLHWFSLSLLKNSLMFIDVTFFNPSLGSF